MNKKQMIEDLKSKCADWHHVYDLFYNKRFCVNRPNINGWYMAHDGPSLSEMYLTNAHPMSDQSGEVITDNDFKSKGQQDEI